MKRLRRIMWNALAALSATLCVGTIVLWKQSHGRSLLLEWHGTSHKVVMISQNGMTNAMYAPDIGIPDRPGLTRLSRTSRGPIRAIPGPGKWGFTFHLGRTIGRPKGNWAIGGQPFYVLWLPHWQLASACALMPVCWVIACVVALRRSRRVRDPLICAAYNYDLRATPDRCPECGTVPAAK